MKFQNMLVGLQRLKRLISGALPPWLAIALRRLTMQFDRRFWVGLWAGLPSWLRRWFGPSRATAAKPQATFGLTDNRAHDPAHQQALALVRAVDAGGLPLHPARVNQIARQLGLEVSSAAPVDEMVARIRVALARLG